MSNTIVKDNVNIVNIVFSGKAYPEIERQKGRITMYTTKKFLFEHGYMSQDDFLNDDLEYSKLVAPLYKAFCDGVLSLNALKQDGVYNLTPVRVSTGLSGKLDTVLAVSTISLANEFCLARMKNKELVCSKCYVPESLRIDGILAYTQNMYVLTHFDLAENPDWIPVIKVEWAKQRIGKELRKAKNDGKITISDEEISLLENSNPLCRFESMGDLACTLQAHNYLLIAHKNPLVDFALWTKNPAVLAYAIDNDGKPENVSTVWSMSRVNLMDKSDRYNAYFDHKFIVVNTDDIRDGYLNRSDYYSCHCEHYSCIRCRHCYRKLSAIDTAVERLREKKLK